MASCIEKKEVLWAPISKSMEYNAYAALTTYAIDHVLHASTVAVKAMVYASPYV
jgi:hypothetical protein